LKGKAVIHVFDNQRHRRNPFAFVFLMTGTHGNFRDAEDAALRYWL
jgi:hypothetical protein